MSTDNPTTSASTVVTGEDEPAPPSTESKPRPPVTEAEAHRPPHPEAGEHGAHPTDRQYILIALVLAAITAVEVGISYAKGLGDASNPLLLILAAIKFFMVVAFFMHLKFDNRVFRRFLVTGIILAGVVYTIVFFTLGIFTSQHGIHG
jgi:cytochrome c oxidase subunit IV